MLIGIDFDSTLFTNWHWLDAFRRETGLAVCYDQIKNWDFSPAVPSYLVGILQQCRTPLTYEDATPEPGATIAVRVLHSAGHRLVVITHDSVAFLGAKKRALANWFPELTELILAENKWAALPEMDILIDDGLHNCPTIVFSQPWNEGATLSPHQRRAQNWADIHKLIYNY